MSPRDDKRRRITLIGWSLLGAYAWLAQLLYTAEAGFGRGWEMVEIAHALAATGRFADPFMTAATGPTATVPPGYPFLLSLFIRALGAGIGYVWGAVICSALAYGLYVMLLAVTAERFTGSRAAATWTALLACFLPAIPSVPQWDLACSLALMMLTFALPDPAPRLQAWLARGALVGVLALFNPAPALLAGLWALWRAYKNERGWRMLAAWACGAVLVVAPWSIRNHYALGTWALRTNSGIALYTSYNDCAESSFVRSFNSGCFNRYQVQNSADETAALQRLGEVAYNQRCTRLAMAWIGSHPARALELTAGRVVEFWLPPVRARWANGAAAWFTTLMGLAGCVVALRAGRREFWFLVLAFALFPLPYYFVVSDQRYSAQLAWALQIPGGWLLATTIEKFRTRRR